jgi:phosphoglucomutase
MRVRLKRLTPEDWSSPELAGDPVVSRQTSAGGGALGGLKVSTAEGWFAVRPSGTEDVYKLYGESFRSDDHLKAIFAEATELVSKLS